MTRFQPASARALFAGIALLLSAQFAHAMPVTLTFSEFNVGQLDGSTVYQPFGISDFADVSQTVSSLFDDGVGITNSPGMVGSIFFEDVVTDVSFVWVTSAGGVSFFAEAFDASGVSISEFEFDGSLATDAQVGLGTLAGLDIARIEFRNSGAQVAIDTLNYVIAGGVNVAEPSVLALFGLGLFGAGVARRVRRER